MLATPWSKIDESTLTQLCHEGAAESITLEFKREPWSSQKNDYRNEFAKDVCAMANAAGGDIVCGIASAAGVADGLVSITTESFDACQLRLEELLANHVQPRVAGVRFKSVPLAVGGYAMVVRVPKSFDGPHRYKVRSHQQFPEHYRFVLRSSTGAIDMDYGQLRNSFGRTTTLLDQAKAFREARFVRLSTGRFQRPTIAGPMIIVHFVPLAGAEQGERLDIQDLYQRADVKFGRTGGFEPSRQTNLDGVLYAAPAAGSNDASKWYVQVFRNGAIEFVTNVSAQDNGLSGPGTKFISASMAGQEIRHHCLQAIESARTLGMIGPAILGVSAIGVGAAPFRMLGPNGSTFDGTPAPQGDFLLPEQWIDEVSSHTEGEANVNRLLDTLWQCFGQVRCDLYSRAGSWSPSR